MDFFRRRRQQETPQEQPPQLPDVMEPEAAANLAVTPEDLLALRAELGDLDLAELPPLELETVPLEMPTVSDPVEALLEQPAEKPSFFQRINPFRHPLERTRVGFFTRIRELFRGRTQIDDDLWEELEEILITADVGAALTEEILEGVKTRVRDERLREPEQVEQALEEELVAMLGEEPVPLKKVDPMTTIMVIGVNGVGKTTSIAKLSYRLKGEGQRLMLAAADTFRAGAVEQLKVWAERVGVPVISHQEGADPGAVAFDAMQAGKARGCDYVIIDTAGRLHTKHNLMEELRKIKRVVQKVDADAPHEVLLVLDAVTGQNAILQAKTFASTVGLTGIIVTKLDSTAKGGAIFAIRRELGAPIKFIATGEKLEDLAPFDARTFVRALFDTDEDSSQTQIT